MANKRLSQDKRALVLAALCEGTPIFRDLPCKRLEFDEQWHYVGIHGQRMQAKEKDRGDFWLWCAIDPDTKLVLSYRVGRRDRITGEDFVADVAKRVSGPVQIATDNHLQYAFHIRSAFGYEGAATGRVLGSQACGREAGESRCQAPSGGCRVREGARGGI